MIYRTLFVSAILCTCCHQYGRAQQSAAASNSVGVSITTPTAIFKSSDMDFEEIEVSNKTSGSVVIHPNGTKTTKGGAKAKGPGEPASFTVAAPPDYLYNITLPQTPVYESDSSANLMNISNFTSNPPTNQVNTGTRTFAVGATVNLEPAQEEGTHNADVPFNVTVGYN